ncbi:MAG: response regulator [Planctomycetota bacterium]
MTILTKRRQLKGGNRPQDAPAHKTRGNERVFSGQHSVLHVDDDPSFCRIVSFKLNRNGITVKSCTQPAIAAKMIEEIGPAAVVLDIQMPPYSGIELLRDIRRRWPALPVLVLSSLTDRATRRAAVADGVARYLNKSTTDWSTLRRHVEDVIVSAPPQWVTHIGTNSHTATAKPHTTFS